MAEKFPLLKYINHAINEYRENGLSDKFQQLCQDVVDTKDARINFTFAKSVSKWAKKMNVISHGEIVQAYGTAEDNYDYARLIKGADTKGHREKIIESESVNFNLLAGKSEEIKDVYAEEFVNKHGAVVSKNGGIGSNFEYIKKNNIAGLDKQAHIQVILNSRSSLYNLKVAKCVEGIDIEPHSMIVAECGSAKENFEFLAITGSDKKRHLNAIIQSQDEVVNLRCLIELNITEINVLRHMKVVFNGADDIAKYEALVWAKRIGCLKELAKRMPEVVAFIHDVNDKKIVVHQFQFRFLNKNAPALKC